MTRINHLYLPGTGCGGLILPIPLLLSIEPWDQVWRRNQQLASRVPGTVFVEPARPGLRVKVRREGHVKVITPVKPFPTRLRVGRAVHARINAAAIRRTLGSDNFIAWATHPNQLDIVLALGVPVIYDRTDDWPEMEDDPVARRQVAVREQHLVAMAAVVTVVSAGMRQQVQRDVVLVPNGVDYKLFADVEAQPPRASFTVGFGGTIDPWRIDIGMLKRIRELGAQLLMIGPGTAPLDADFVGPRSPAEVARLLHTCDALVAPYRTDRVANQTSDALKLYEYFATGLPVIASPVAGFERYRDLVVNWPVSAPLAPLCSANRALSDKRRAVAHAADWGVRAQAFRDLLAGI